ncbi:MAG: serine/threonine-protein phosphatase [Clostridia bacterium]|nr:serine/threonine-protein phosphatase [Clostridia bacterium]
MTDVYMYTNRGGRDHNEDCADFVFDENGAMFVVADGLGGLGGGDVASQAVIDTMKSAWKAKMADTSPSDWLRDAIEKANQVVMQKQAESGGRMKSTVVSLVVTGSRWANANVGDARLYRISNGMIKALTQDHSVAYKKYTMGEITYDELYTDEDQSRLLRSVGEDSRCIPDISESSEPINPGDAFLLCTDGIWGKLFNEEILVDCLKASTAQEWTELMLMRIMPRLTSTSDNLTLIAIKF